ncbi:hypothetical protein AAD018_013840 [Aestuariibius insulae]|uniref:hypothetical protein n=1 Tax=Aestuariibius insulae TaxID=2058287 RepID=UPI00345E30C8
MSADPKFPSLTRYRISFDGIEKTVVMDGYLKPSMADELDAIAAFIRTQEGYHEPT